MDSYDDSQPSPSKAARLSTCRDQETQHNHDNDFATIDVQALYAELTCGICLELMHLPTCMLPCLHTFCWACSKQSLSTQNKCPSCATVCTSARLHHSYGGLVELLLKSDPSLAKPQDELSQQNASLQAHQERTSCAAGTITPVVPKVEPRDALANAFWPCHYCYSSGEDQFRCSLPVPRPEPGMGVNPSESGDWADIEFARSAGLTSAQVHAQCHDCRAWVPRKGVRSLYCAGCGQYSCRDCSDEEPLLSIEEHQDCFMSIPTSDYALLLDDADRKDFSGYLQHCQKGACDVVDGLYAMARKVRHPEATDSRQNLDDDSITSPLSDAGVNEAEHDNVTSNDQRVGVTSRPTPSAELTADTIEDVAPTAPMAVIDGASEGDSPTPDLWTKLSDRSSLERAELSREIAGFLLHGFFDCSCALAAFKVLLPAWFDVEKESDAYKAYKVASAAELISTSVAVDVEVSAPSVPDAAEDTAQAADVEADTNLAANNHHRSSVLEDALAPALAVRAEVAVQTTAMDEPLEVNVMTSKNTSLEAATQTLVAA